MIITPSMLTYMLSRTRKVREISRSDSGTACDIQFVKIIRPGSSASCRDQEKKTDSEKDSKKDEAGERTLFIRETGKHRFFMDTAAGFHAEAEAEESAAELQAEILILMNRLVRWDAGMTDAVLRQQELTPVLDAAGDIFPLPFSLFSVDMEVIYSSEGDYGDPDSGGDFSEQLQALLLDEKFHKAVSEKSIFYYSSLLDGQRSLCCNLSLGGKYYARMVMLVGLKAGRLPEGLEELYLHFCRRIEEILNVSPALLTRRMDDRMHRMIRALVASQEVPLGTVYSVAEEQGSSPDATLIVIRISFFSNEGWDTQYEATIPYLARILETRWKHSCAVPLDKDLIWLVDLDRSSEDVGSHEFYQQVAFFVRDHVCNAGVSSAFHGYENIPYGVKEATTALEIGHTEQPHFWYYRFDDYQMDYMMGRITEEIPADMFCHPAVRILEQTDLERKTDLAGTLKTYLRCNMNDTRTSQQLHIHRTTLFRRLERIQTLTGIDLADPDTVLALLIYWRMKEASC